MKRAVFLDRDGVLNESILRDGKPYAPESVEQVVIPSDTAEALRRLKANGFSLVVITNQPDVARGMQTKGEVEAIHQHLSSLLPIQDFFVCYHDDRDDCNCRKPKPGLLQAAAVIHGIDLRSSYMIGDRWRDIDAGATAGCRTILIDHHYNEQAPTHPPDTSVSTLTEAVHWILQQENSSVPTV